MEKLYLDNCAEVLELVALTEAGVRDFYRACAAQWPDDGDFWLGLAAEEEGHCKMVTRMTELVKAEPVLYSLHRQFATGAYRSFIAWIKTCTAGVANGSLRNSEAVDMAHTIETTILESQMQELVMTSEPEYLRLIAQLIDQTRKHAISVKARFAGLIKEGSAR